MTHCIICHRELTDPESIKKGIGPVCAAREASALYDEEEYQPILLDEGSLLDVGLICRRLPDGRLACNLPQRHKSHSPTGFEAGYGGSGPADLALNILAAFLPGKGVKLWDGTQLSQEAWGLHQQFKGEFIASMDREGGHIPADAIRGWIETHLPQPSLLEDE